MNETDYTLQSALQRRGIDLGVVQLNVQSNEHMDEQLNEINASQASALSLRTLWEKGQSVFLPSLCVQDLDGVGLNGYQADIEQSKNLYEAVLAGEQSCDELLDQMPYKQRLAQNFESLGCSMNEGDDQEIETVLFDAVKADAINVNKESFDNENVDKANFDEINIDEINIDEISTGDVIAEDLWMKASWLSFHDEDASLRFRFSFGVDLHEDVAADSLRQHYAALLADAVFPESQLITNNTLLEQHLTQVLNTNQFSFVERIVYFNSPNGGAYLHHDRERGHAGVVYAQLTGQTLWLALPKQALMHELTHFVEFCQQEAWPESIDSEMQQELLTYANDHQLCSEQLETFANDTLIQLINETQAFVQQLIAHGHGKHLQAGDVLLLPQETELSCCWHSVFCLGEKTGQALSFAIRQN